MVIPALHLSFLDFLDADILIMVQQERFPEYFRPGVAGNCVKRTNLPNIRVAYRWVTELGKMIMMQLMSDTRL